MCYLSVKLYLEFGYIMLFIMEQRLGLPENILYIDILLHSDLKWILMFALMGDGLRKGIPAVFEAGNFLNNKAKEAALGQELMKNMPQSEKVM